MKNHIIQAFKFIGIVVVLSVTLLVVFWEGLHLWGDWNDEWNGWNEYYEGTRNYLTDGVCNIAVLPVLGDIISYRGADKDGLSMTDDLPPSVNPEDVDSFLKLAENDEYIVGVIADIDSSGGSGSAGDAIANRLKRSSKPTVALVRDSANSAGYLIATGADAIIASPFADVGSIGITMSYLDYTKQNEEQGIEFVSLSSGKYKDSWNPDKALTEEERALFERDLKISHDVFVKEVAENRNMPVEDVAKLADGSTLPAPLALEAKLIDQVGGEEEARAWFAKELNIPLEKVVLCR